MNTVLIAVPPRGRTERHDMRGFPHLGLAYLAASLRTAGFKCSVIDANFEGLGLAELIRRLLQLNPDLLGITAMTHEIRRAHEVATLIKKEIPALRILVGGAHATALPRQSLEEFPAFDIAVFSEGELTILELVKALENSQDLEGIKGLVYRSKDGIRQNMSREPISDIESLPFPAWDLFPSNRVYPVQTARGCPFSCNFCMRVMGNRVRKRSPESVMDELELLVNKYGAKTVYFMDETFTVDRKYINTLLDLMIANNLPSQLKWEVETRVDLVDLELLKKMKEAGCQWVAFGIESGNREVLERSGKGITVEKAEVAVKAAKKAGLRTDAFFIIGHPFENHKTVSDTVALARRLNTTRLTLGLMTPYPGTQVYEMAKKGEGGYKLISDDWDDFNKNIGNSLELESLNRKQMERFQMWGYVSFYLFNFRLIAGLQYLRYHWRLGVAILRKFFGRGRPK